MVQTKKERTGWRDQALSERHREWGYNLPAVDIDFLLIEFDQGIARAIIEYKHEWAQEENTSSKSYQAISGLANAAKLPFFVVSYGTDLSWYKVMPRNGNAYQCLSSVTTMKEDEYVQFLFRLRRR